MNTQYIVAAMLVSAWVTGCTREPSPSAETQPAAVKPAFPVVNETRTDLLFRYRTEDGWSQALTVAEVPAESRTLVQVIDLSLPPKARNSAGYIHLVDLTKTDASGVFTGHTIPRGELEKALAKDAEPAPQVPIIMYSTSWCGVCKKAAKYMRDNELIFQEKDIEKDRDAARALMAKKKAQGVPGNGVPVFDIGGKLLGGFDPGSIMKLARPKG